MSAQSNVVSLINETLGGAQDAETLRNKSSLETEEKEPTKCDVN